ncbi:hypothetical protein M3Y99_00980800 [Aphelenchoides fujianensis]|nr:hypothetical protein M3Y99_00980800 [Aphelenchoides fujianensis]
MRPFYASELKRVQEEIGGLRADVAKWEADVNRNEMSVVELGGRLQQLKLQLVEKRTQLDEGEGARTIGRPSAINGWPPSTSGRNNPSAVRE